MNKITIATLGICAMIGSILPTVANAQLIEILCTQTEPCGKYTGTTADGTIFDAEANPTLPATGTGVFQPFVRIQTLGTGMSGMQNGYNTDKGEPDINFDTKASIWTHSVLFSDLGTIMRGGISYYLFQLDSNEPGGATSALNQITITDIQLYIGDSTLKVPEDNGGYTGTEYDSSDNSLAGFAPSWTLDNLTNGNVNVLLQSSICDNPGTCGSGKGDLNLFIPVSMLSSFGYTPEYFVFYSEYAGADSGFEEWRYLAKATQIPEPMTIALFGAGLLGLGLLRRRKTS